MYDDDDDTVPHAPAPERVISRELADDVANGVTVLREGGVRADPVALPPVPAVLLPRHRIRIGDSVLELSRPVRIGRSPRRARVPVGEQPVLISVDSPDRQISANHVEIREHGNTVVVSDLRTLNGSDVHRPDARVVPLRRGESLVVSAGARIDLGEGVVVEVLAPVAKAVRP